MPPEILDIRNAEDLRDVVHRAVEAIAAGKVVAFPTETIYGIGVSARNSEAIQKLLLVKNRAPNTPFTLAIRSPADLVDYAPQASLLAQRLARRCWPGPITLVVDSSPNDYGLVTQLPREVQQTIAPNGTVGLRVPANGITLDVLRMMVGPLALTSANLSGKPAATTAQEVTERLGDEVDLILDDGPCRYGQPSSVIRVTENRFKMLREGVVGNETMQRLANYLVIIVCTGNTCRSPMGEALMRQQLAKSLGCTSEELQERGYGVLSAGIAAAVGCPPSSEAVTIMKEMKLDISEHAAQPLTQKLVQHADLILTMTQGHRHAIINQWPEAAARVHLVQPSGHDVSDPIGAPTEIYRRCAEQIRDSLTQRVGMVLPSSES